MRVEFTQHLHRVTVAGAEIRYLRVGHGTPIVLVHTLRTQLEYFGALLAHLDTRRLEVRAIDLPGHGESGAPPVDYTADYFTHTVGELLEVCEVRDAIVVGESIGGSRSRSPRGRTRGSTRSWPSTPTITVAGEVSAEARRSRTCSSPRCSSWRSGQSSQAQRRKESSAACSRAASTIQLRYQQTWSKGCRAAARCRDTHARSAPSALTGGAGSTRA